MGKGMEYDIGRVIKELRVRENISQEKLCKGLCSVATLSRIEMGDRTADILLSNALIQRMGKSPEKFDVILQKKEILFLDKQVKIARLMKDKRWIEARKRLESYEKEQKGNHLQMQFVKMKQAEIFFFTDDFKKSWLLFQEALGMTLETLIGAGVPYMELHSRMEDSARGSHKETVLECFIRTDLQKEYLSVRELRNHILMIALDKAKGI